MAIDFKKVGYKRHQTNQERHDHRTFTFPEVHDIVDLIKNGKRPDWQFGDEECNLWLMIVSQLGIDIK